MTSSTGQSHGVIFAHGWPQAGMEEGIDRVFVGVGAQMVMTDVSGSTERADALGKLGVSYGVGMVVGPMVGGYVTAHYSEQIAAGVAAAICVLGIVIVWLFVPANTKTISPSKSADNKDKPGRGRAGQDGKE